MKICLSALLSQKWAPQEQAAPVHHQHSTDFGQWPCCTSPAFVLLRMDRQTQTHFHTRNALLPYLFSGYSMYTPENGPPCPSLVLSLPPGRSPMPRAGSAPGVLPVCPALDQGPGCRSLQMSLHPLSFCPVFYTATQYPVFVTPLTCHYSLFSSLPLKKHISTPTCSISCPCHQRNI